MDASAVTEVLVIRVRHELVHNWLQPLAVDVLLGTSRGIQQRWWVLYSLVDEELNRTVDGVVGFGRVRFLQVRWGTVLLLLLAAQADRLKGVLKHRQGHAYLSKSSVLCTSESRWRIFLQKSHCTHK